MPDPGYQEVPVGAAQHIAHAYGKDIVIVLAYDWERNMLHTTTYGRQPLHKDEAAEWGRKLSNFLYQVPSAAHVYADYRATPAAEAQAKIEALEARVKELERADRAINLMRTSPNPLVVNVAERLLQTVDSMEAFTSFLKQDDPESEG